MSILDKLLNDKVVGVWGMGYLAYTYALHLQSKGFGIRLTDLADENLSNYRKGKYPIQEQRHV